VDDNSIIDLPGTRSRGILDNGLGGFAASGFRVSTPAVGVGESLIITPECAWPLGVNEHDAKTVCRMFHNLTPEQRARVLTTRK
jgi:hypothetical protein